MYDAQAEGARQNAGRHKFVNHGDQSAGTPGKTSNARPGRHKRQAERIADDGRPISELAADQRRMKAEAAERRAAREARQP